MAKTTNKSSDSKIYWAADTTDKCADACLEKIDDYYTALQQMGYNTLWKRLYTMYFSGSQRSARLNKAGDEGEYTLISVNQFRNLLLHILQLATGQRPAWEPRAVNSDVESQKQTILARGLLDYYMREKRVERDLDKAAEFSLVFGEGFVSTLWNATAGKLFAVDPTDGAEIREGDIEFGSHEPIDVVRDVRLEEFRLRDWLIVRTYHNKYQLMAKYPEFADILVSEKLELTAMHHYRTNGNNLRYGSDQIPLYTLYHVKNDACPNGRQLQLLQDGTVLTDGPLPYEHLPIYRVAPNEVYGTPFGYSVSFDLAAMQENYDNLYSTIITNQEMFGVTNLLVPKGSGYNVVDLAGQMKVIEYDAGQDGKPEVLELLKTPAELFNFMKQMEADMQTISGINSVSRGAPPSDMSGAALALIQSMAIQFNGAMQQSYVEMLEDVGTSTIQILKKYASVPRVAAISGKYNKSFLQEFSKDDISSIDRVIVDIGNAAMQTTAGKVQLAEQMEQMGFLKTPDELMSVINTGTLQPLEQGEEMELLYVQQENEELKEGRPCIALVTDNHRLHITEHKAVLADIDVRNDMTKRTAAMQHLQDHMNILMEPANANLLQLLGQPVVPPAPGGPGQNPGSALPGAPQVPGGNANAQVASMQPNQPSMPTNPLTKQKFTPQTGGQ